MPRSMMIFAAGFGTRMGALTKDLPKPMLPVAGQPMIDIAISMGRSAGLSTLVANTHYLAHRIEPHLTERGVAISREEPEILDTGGGLKAALPLLGPGPVVTMNPDAGWRGPNPVEQLLGAWREDDGALLLVVPMERALGRQGGGDFTLDGGRLSRGGDYVYCGVQILRTEILADISDTAFSLNQVWDRLNADGRLRGIEYAGDWCDIGHPEGLTLAERMMATGHV
ncbi:NTP transferase domain-containing protein [Alphaproteobacteria bacterium GH1-50]|uniref:NTP transferase domain-containing protein n=2 Tax=Kangsaoukella pontilimi TaxID=2691042 RepID=A0A7C9IGS4_9RHOB|nr:NTP transferase domain-containing protein [Kangsaoukella pontilimi]